MTRTPIVAGTFYEASADACRQSALKLLDEAVLPAEVPERCLGGLVPHAGWVCSGAVAAMTLKALRRNWSGQTIVLLGAVHAVARPEAMLYDTGAWRTPLGDVPIDAEIAAVILAGCPDVVADPRSHGREHSLEVQLPLIQQVFPEARIVPMMVPPAPLAAGIGRQLAKCLAQYDPAPLIVGSTDLTHYGPRYGITPAGIGKVGIDWAMDNDRRLLELIETMRADNIVPETSARHNACGGGAIAATVAACGELGATKGVLLRHTNSAETLAAYHGDTSTDAVGYASVVFA